MDRVDALEHLDHPERRERVPRFERDTLVRQVVDEHEAAEHAAVGQRITHEVHAPALRPPLRRRQRNAHGRDALDPTTPACHSEAFFTVEKTRHLLVIHHVPLPSQQHMEPLVAPPRPNEDVVPASELE